MMNRFHTRILIFLTAILPLAAADLAHPEVLYLNKLNQPALRLKVLRSTALNLTPAPNTYQTTLGRGQTVDLLAIGDDLLLVRGRMSTGAVQGWVRRDDIAPIPAEFIENAEKKLSEQKQMQEAIKRKEVVFGMTEEQVRSMLGRPEDRARVKEESQTVDVWTYYSYRSLPVTEVYGYGTNATSRSYIQKVRTGSRSIHFQDGKVVRIEEKTEEPQTPPSVGTPIVVPKAFSY